MRRLASEMVLVLRAREAETGRNGETLRRAAAGRATARRGNSLADSRGEIVGLFVCLAMLGNLEWWGEFDETILTRPEMRGNCLTQSRVRTRGSFSCLELEAKDWQGLSGRHCGATCQTDLSLARDRARVFDAFSIPAASPRRVDRAPLIDRPTLSPSSFPKLCQINRSEKNIANLLDCLHAVSSVLNDSLYILALVSIHLLISAVFSSVLSRSRPFHLRVFSCCLVSALRQCLTRHPPMATLPARSRDSQRALLPRHRQPPPRVQ